jgi:hypothetical protein
LRRAKASQAIGNEWAAGLYYRTVAIRSRSDAGIRAIAAAHAVAAIEIHWSSPYGKPLSK